MNNNSKVLWENSKVIVIVSGIKTASTNVKTGGLLQIYILVKACKPTEAYKIGLDSLICGTCIHRGENSKARSCYVNLGQGPRAVWQSWKNGKVENFNNDYSIFENRKVRFGTYGDPALIPAQIVDHIKKTCLDYVGYTHQWKDNNSLGRSYMLSADSKHDAHMALQWGLGNTFRTTTEPDDLLPHERACPASDTVTCADCMACNDKAKYSRVILIHGSGKKHFQEVK